MHDGEIHIDSDLVGALVAAQFPRLANLPVSEVRSTGTVNAIYRIGDDLCARLPRIQKWALDLDRETLWLPKLASGLSLQVPEPVGNGHPTGSYPCSWSVYRWIDGEPYADRLVDDESQAARDLARFVLQLRRIDPAGAPRAGREPLSKLDALTRTAIESARRVIDSEAATAAWQLALEAPPWEGSPVWIHTDLLRPNLLVHDGRLCAVIDFGGVGVGDPAADVIASWSVFSQVGRDVFRDALEVDDETWNRARGFALHQAAMIIPYYGQTNPRFVTLAKRTVEEVLAEING